LFADENEIVLDDADDDNVPDDVDEIEVLSQQTMTNPNEIALHEDDGDS
jgi:hypothetical protein